VNYKKDNPVSQLVVRNFK